MKTSSLESKNDESRFGLTRALSQSGATPERGQSHRLPRAAQSGNPRVRRDRIYVYWD
jgi:hypothetical protein